MHGYSLKVLVFCIFLLHTGNYDPWVVFMQCWFFYFMLCACGRSMFHKHSEIDVWYECDIRYNWDANEISILCARISFPGWLLIKIRSNDGFLTKPKLVTWKTCICVVRLCFFNITFILITLGIKLFLY